MDIVQEKEDWINAIGQAIVRQSRRYDSSTIVMLFLRVQWATRRSNSSSVEERFNSFAVLQCPDGGANRLRLGGTLRLTADEARQKLHGLIWQAQLLFSPFPLLHVWAKS